MLHLASQVFRVPIKLLKVLTNMNLEPVEAMLHLHPRTTRILVNMESIALTPPVVTS